MYENKLSNYIKACGRFPSQLNLVYLWHYKDIETKRDLEHVSKKVIDILRHMESLGIEIPPSNDPKPKKSHSGQKLNKHTDVN